MRTLSLLTLLSVLAAGASGCGASDGGSSRSQNGTTQAASGSALVAKVEHAKAEIDGGSLVASAQVTEGGKPGKRLTLRYGLVDAVSGVRASESERVAATYTTTAHVVTKEVSIRVPKPATPTDYLLHFVLSAPDGSYLASSDSDVFTVR